MRPRVIRQAGYVGSPNYYVCHIELDVYHTQVLKVMGFGDVSCKPFSVEQSHQAISTKEVGSLDAGIIPVVLVGDYCMTLPSATAVAQRNGVGKVDKVHFDAIADI